MKVETFTAANVKAQFALGCVQMTIHALREGLRAMNEFQGQEKAIAQVNELLPKFEAEAKALQMLSDHGATVVIGHDMCMGASAQNAISDPYMAMYDGLVASGAKKVQS